MSCENNSTGRRDFLKQATVVTAMSVVPASLIKAGVSNEKVIRELGKEPVTLEINGKVYNLTVDPRMSLLDLLREQLHLTGTKKGCDQGHCGACMVHVNGSRSNSCLTLAADISGAKITTIEGLSTGEELHPMQKAFIKHDAFQCGFCTSGQIMSGVACVREGHANTPGEIREYMNDNICRCGAYPNIVAAISEVNAGGGKI